MSDEEWEDSSVLSLPSAEALRGLVLVSNREDGLFAVHTPSRVPIRWTDGGSRAVTVPSIEPSNRPSGAGVLVPEFVAAPRLSAGLAVLERPQLVSGSVEPDVPRRKSPWLTETRRGWLLACV